MGSVDTLFYYEKTPTESYRILCEAYDEHVPFQNTYWFKYFRNDNFSVKDKERPGRSSKFEHQQLQALLDEDAYQS